MGLAPAEGPRGMFSCSNLFNAGVRAFTEKHLVGLVDLYDSYPSIQTSRPLSIYMAVTDQVGSACQGTSGVAVVHAQAMAMAAVEPSAAELCLPAGTLTSEHCILSGGIAASRLLHGAPISPLLDGCLHIVPGGNQQTAVTCGGGCKMLQRRLVTGNALPSILPFPISCCLCCSRA